MQAYVTSLVLNLQHALVYVGGFTGSKAFYQRSPGLDDVIKLRSQYFLTGYSSQLGHCIVPHHYLILFAKGTDAEREFKQYLAVIAAQR